MRYLSANYVFPGNSAPIKDGVVVLDHEDSVVDVLNPDEDKVLWNNVEKHEGILCPGFVNSHCHLELSYLKGKIEQKKQLHGFIKDVVALRDQPSLNERLKSIQEADKEMWNNGIVFVGDISNGDTTFELKNTSRLGYYTFIELFGVDPVIAETNFNRAKQLFNAYPQKQHVAITAHATYSVSDRLSEFINDHNVVNKGLFSLHNQETESENKLFKEGKGALYDFLKEGLGQNFEPSGKNALPSFLKRYQGLRKVLLVHNTFTMEEDVQWANHYSDAIYWAFCPNANLYIENKLPDFSLFNNHFNRCTIGTDSLASNDGLCVLEELKTISKHTNQISLSALIQMATYNGAAFFDQTDSLGSIEKGKAPGVNLITNINLDHLQLTNLSKVIRLA